VDIQNILYHCYDISKCINLQNTFFLELAMIYLFEFEMALEV
jgi:hypothetical protein